MEDFSEEKMFETVKSIVMLMDPHPFPKLVLLQTRNAHQTKKIGQLPWESGVHNVAQNDSRLP